MDLNNAYCYFTVVKLAMLAVGHFASTFTAILMQVAP